MWRGESRGSLLLGRVLLHLPEPPPGEARGGRPREPGGPALRGRELGGQAAEREAGRGVGRPGIESGTGRGAIGGGGGPPRPRRRRTKGDLCARRGPQGPAEVRAARPRPLVPGCAASSSSSAPRRPGAPVPATGLAPRPLAGGRGGQSPAPHASRPPGRCVFMNSINGALTAHTKPFLLLGRDRGGGGPCRLERFLFPEAQEKF